MVFKTERHCVSLTDVSEFGLLDGWRNGKSSVGRPDGPGHVPRLPGGGRHVLGSPLGHLGGGVVQSENYQWYSGRC